MITERIMSVIEETEGTVSKKSSWDSGRSVNDEQFETNIGRNKDLSLVLPRKQPEHSAVDAAVRKALAFLISKYERYDSEEGAR